MFDRSAETDKIFAAFVKFQTAMPPVEKNSTVKVTSQKGSGYSFKYAELSEVIEKAKKPLGANNLGVTQLLVGDKLRTYLIHESGQFIGAETDLRFTPADPQKLGSIITYLRRYAYVAILGISASDDDDANIATGNKYEKPENNKLPTNGQLQQAKQTQNEPVSPPDKLATPYQRKRIFAIAKDLGYESEDTKARVKTHYDLDSFTKLTELQAAEMIKQMVVKQKEREVSQTPPTKDIPFDEIGGDENV